MPNKYVVFDADKKFNNVIICEEDWVLPEGFSKQLIDDQHYWNWEKQEMLINKNAPIKIESI